MDRNGSISNSRTIPTADWGADQNIAIFGKPGDDKFEFVMTGRHMTCAATAIVGPRRFWRPDFYGHAASGFNEKVHHPGNVFWPQALEANKVYAMLDEQAKKSPWSTTAARRQRSPSAGQAANIPALPVTDLSSDQKEQLQKVLADAAGAVSQGGSGRSAGCLKEQGGLDKCCLAFYKEGDIGNDRCGTAGGWKARRSSGTSAASRTFTSGSTWPTILRWQRNSPWIKTEPVA